MDADVAQSPVVSFRPVKRQKYMRKRTHDDLPIQSQATREQEASPAQDSSLGEQEPSGNDITGSSSNVVRFRKSHRLRKGGIEFSTNRKEDLDQNTQLESALEETETDILRARFDRFTAHTGQQVDVDKHMMEYIESELSKRQNRSQRGEGSTAASRADTADASHLRKDSFSRREPASLGKLQEIDLGQEAKLQNIARTEAATRLMVGNPSLSAVGSSPNKSQVGKDIHMGRNRMRNCEDLERDRLVDEVLRESKLDVYDEPEQELSQEDQAADDRIAEQFRRDFMEAIQSRRRTRTAPTTNNSKVAKPEAPRGPKLGGSRSARAAMREMQEKIKKKPS
ncbi:hepatocellular carcinoma-associated antigen 59-domain-containing protein [Talaromyces proteolyticus]|uniref:Hepatocellular carcinoma-associated antigen 59-domain-containing protein n=1 Tax=Talaromyces proteolyticus TaxID=1131652 RepID=A0AAD4KZD5_9EURO|nr:hepatocellular carcinoma-associated antigen 59-domain-containing protein [Talaromyces proteolyticus]KAH8704718.1 hepatocellular carcinoma-associated antigen 59-domain-containing protein [Talaromyces proteolyticus]